MVVGGIENEFRGRVKVLHRFVTRNARVPRGESLGRSRFGAKPLSLEIGRSDNPSPHDHDVSNTGCRSLEPAFVPDTQHNTSTSACK